MDWAFVHSYPVQATFTYSKSLSPTPSNSPLFKLLSFTLTHSIFTNSHSLQATHTYSHPLSPTPSQSLSLLPTPSYSHPFPLITNISHQLPPTIPTLIHSLSFPLSLTHSHLLFKISPLLPTLKHSNLFCHDNPIFTHFDPLPLYLYWNQSIPTHSDLIQLTTTTTNVD